MKLVHPDLQYQFCLDCPDGCEWIIESPKLLAKYVGELICQAEGETGNFVLSEEGKELNISKNMEVIVNPFALNVNDKKILSKLYVELTELAAGEVMYLATQEIKHNIQSYFLELEQLSSFVLESDSEIDMTVLLKSIGVKIEHSATDFFENMISYLRLITELLGKKIIVMVNIQSYITEKQLEELWKTADYCEFSLILIENRQRGFSKTRNQYIIDKDYCEIF